MLSLQLLTLNLAAALRSKMGPKLLKSQFEIQLISDYRTRAIISRGLYTFLPDFLRPFMYCDLWPYV